MRENDQEIRVLVNTLTDLQQAYELNKTLLRHGLASELQVAQAKTALDQTSASVQSLRISRAQSEHAIAVLLGRTVESFSIPVQPDTPQPLAVRETVTPSFRAKGIKAKKSRLSTPAK